MIEVVLYDKPLGKPFKKVLVPERWEEASIYQWLQLSTLLYTVAPEDLDTLFARAVVVLFDLDEFDLERVDAAVVKEELFDYVKWISEPYALTEQRIEKVRVGSRFYHGPVSGMDNLKAVEFHFSEQYFNSFLQSKSLEDLYLFVAVLYRPAKGKGYNKKLNPDGDLRVAFNDNLLSRDAKKLRKAMPLRYAYAIVLWYRACRQVWIDEHKRIFKRDAPDSEEANSAGYFALMRMIAQKGTYGTFEKVEQMYVVNMLADFELELDEQNKTKQEIEKMKHGTQ